MKKAKPAKDHRNDPTYWFAILEIARDRHDSALIAEADSQLRRLGVLVTYSPTALSTASSSHAIET